MEDEEQTLKAHTKLPDDYNTVVFDIKIEEWIFTMDNEYGSTLLELSLENFNAKYK